MPQGNPRAAAPAVGDETPRSTESGQPPGWLGANCEHIRRHVSDEQAAHGAARRPRSGATGPPRVAGGGLGRSPKSKCRLVALLAAGILAAGQAPLRAQDTATAEQQFHQETTRALARGELDEAEALAAARAADDPAAAAVRAAVLVRRGRYAEAETLLGPIAQAAPASAAALEMGLLLQRVGRAREAAGVPGRRGRLRRALAAAGRQVPRRSRGARAGAVPAGERHVARRGARGARGSRHPDRVGRPVPRQVQPGRRGPVVYTTR